MPPAPKYDLDAEIARMVELSRQLAEATEATVAAVRRERSRLAHAYNLPSLPHFDVRSLPKGLE